MDPYRSLPSVNDLLKDPLIRGLQEHQPDPMVRLIRRCLDEARLEIKEKGVPVEKEALLGRIREELVRRSPMKRLINATGVLLHTNLGRAPLPVESLETFLNLALGYCNIEYDIDSGTRQSRDALLRPLLKDLFGAEDGVVVNNNAGALLLVVNTLASGKEALISRGELIEIGSSFRILDILSKSGARIREVGSTNKTRLADYEEALSPETGVLIKVHCSNYKISGFAQSPSIEELVYLSRQTSVPFFYDLGSGSLAFPNFDGVTLADEEISPQQALKLGGDVVTFSGDKFLGGPQAGFIIGKKEIIRLIKKNPLTRALRLDKLSLSVLCSFLPLYFRKDAAARIPFLRMVQIPVAELQRRAEKLSQNLTSLKPSICVKAAPMTAEIGGGALPLVEIPSWGLEVTRGVGSEEGLAHYLRTAHQIIPTIREGKVFLNLRTVFEDEDLMIAKALQKLWEKSSPEHGAG